jgi:hypothetical protein
MATWAVYHFRVTVPATVTVPEGATSAAFAIVPDTIHRKKEKSTEIAVSYNGVTLTATITVAPQASASLQPVAQCASIALIPCLTASAIAMTYRSKPPKSRHPRHKCALAVQRCSRNRCVQLEAARAMKSFTASECVMLRR